MKFDVSIRQTRYATVSVEANSRDEALDKVSDAVKADNVSWRNGALVFGKTKEEKTPLDDVIAGCREASEPRSASKEPEMIQMPGTEGNWGERHWGSR